MALEIRDMSPPEFEKWYDEERRNWIDFQDECRQLYSFAADIFNEEKDDAKWIIEERLEAYVDGNSSYRCLAHTVGRIITRLEDEGYHSRAEEDLIYRLKYVRAASRPEPLTEQGTLCFVRCASVLSNQVLCRMERWAS